jgi:hypothetical protein
MTNIEIRCEAYPNTRTRNRSLALVWNGALYTHSYHMVSLLIIQQFYVRQNKAGGVRVTNIEER